MNALIVLNHQPYDGTDVTWNALRLAQTLHEDDVDVRIFLMNDAVDLARETCVLPEDYDQDLVALLKSLMVKGIEIKACGVCLGRAGKYLGHPAYDGIETSSMKALSQWVIESERVLTF